jgi:hypothetical protein
MSKNFTNLELSVILDNTALEWDFEKVSPEIIANLSEAAFAAAALACRLEYLIYELGNDDVESNYMAQKYLYQLMGMDSRAQKAFQEKERSTVDIPNCGSGAYVDDVSISKVDKNNFLNKLKNYSSVLERRIEKISPAKKINSIIAQQSNLNQQAIAL